MEKRQRPQDWRLRNTTGSVHPVGKRTSDVRHLPFHFWEIYDSPKDSSTYACLEIEIFFSLLAVRECHMPSASLKTKSIHSSLFFSSVHFILKSRSSFYACRPSPEPKVPLTSGILLPFTTSHPSAFWLPFPVCYRPRLAVVLASSLPRVFPIAILKKIGPTVDLFHFLNTSSDLLSVSTHSLSVLGVECVGNYTFIL